MVWIAVIGCGKMGVKIAGELAYHGHRVRIYDGSLDALNKVYEQLQSDRKMLLKEGLMNTESFLGQVLCMSRLEETVADADFIFEAVTEDLGVKQDLFERISHLCRPDTVMASNTLRFAIEEIAERTVNPERCVGMRFLFPVYCIPEVEIMPGPKTAPAAIEKVRLLVERMGKTLFFRSGQLPLILTEEQRDARKQARIEQMKISGGIGTYIEKVIPTLHHKGNMTPRADDSDAIVPSNMDRDCAICMNRLRNCLLSPCNHMVTCYECAKMLINRKDGCPICRKDIVEAVKVFYS